MIQPYIRNGIDHASVRYARANNKLMGTLYNPQQPTSYIIPVDVDYLYGWAMSQEMLNGDFEFVTDDECRNIKQLLNYPDGRFAIFDTGLFDHRKNQKDKISFILEVDLEYPFDLHERGDDYPLVQEIMTIEPEITGEKKHNLRAQYSGAACPYSRKLICLFFPKKHYVVLGQQLRFYLDRGMMLVKVHSAIRFKSSSYAASYIANNTEKRKQFKHDNVKKTSTSQ